MTSDFAPESRIASPAAPRAGTARRALARVGVAGAVAGGVAAVTALGLGGGAWYFANQLLDPRTAGDPYRLKVADLDERSVTLPATADTRLPGPAALQWPGGYGLLGPGSHEVDGQVRRRLTHRIGVPIRIGTRTRIKRHAFEGDPQVAFGIPFQEVALRGPHGPLPAWLVPGPPATPGAAWGNVAITAVIVHGRGHTRPATLRLIPDLHDLGLTALVATYRNDVGAPPSPDGHYHLGDTEWLDLQAAVREATERGAQRVVLVGDSMGGAIILQFLRRSARGDCVAAVVLDSPVLDWRAVLALAAHQRHLPGVLASLATGIARRRLGLDWDRFDHVAQAAMVTRPMLIIHGDADTTVPVASSDALARLRPDIVTYRRVPGADHLDAWTVDRPGCSAALRAFLATALAPGGPGAESRGPEEAT